MSTLNIVVTPDANPQSIDWTKATDLDLQDQDGDSLAISMEKFDERGRRQREAFQRAREEKAQKRREKEEAERKRKEAEEVECK